MKEKNDNFSASEKSLMIKLLKQKLKNHKPDPVFKNAIFGNLVQKHFINHSNKKYHEGFFKLFFKSIYYGARTFSFVLGLTFLLVSLGMTSTYAYLSPNVNSDSNLYFLKRTIEDVEFTITVSDEKKARKLLKFADRRREEAEVLSERGIVDTKAIEEIAENTNQAIEITKNIKEGHSKDELKELLIGTSDKQKNSLSRIVAKLEDTEEPITIKDNGHSEIINPREINLDTIEGDISDISSSEVQRVVNADTEVVGSLKQKINDFEEMVETKEVTEVKISKKNEIADLMLQKISSSSFKNGQQGIITVTFSNIGTIKANQINLEVNWDDGDTDKKFIPSVDINESLKIPFSHIYKSSGIYQIQTKIDSDNVTYEKSEANNSQVIEVNVELSCQNQCNQEGIQKCQENDIHECQQNHLGCLEWQLIQICDNGMLCENTSCIPACKSNCSEIGAKKCQGDAVQVCTHSSEGCYIWENEDICDINEYCTNGSCKSQCEDECNQGVSRCFGSTLERCDDFDGDGCTEWIMDECGEGFTCENGICEPKCNYDCLKNGERKCIGNSIKECGYWTDEYCLTWREIETCSSEEVCDSGNCTNPLPPGWDPDDFEKEF